MAASKGKNASVFLVKTLNFLRKGCTYGVYQSSKKEYGFTKSGPSQAEKNCKEEIRMRNLKRALSLTLASVMCCMLVVVQCCGL